MRRGGRGARPTAPSADDIVAVVESLIARTDVFGALDTLENLKKGGRIGGAQALLGTLLSIKPSRHHARGVVEEAGEARTRRKALEWLATRCSRARRSSTWPCSTASARLDEFLDLLAPRLPARPDHASARSGRSSAPTAARG